MARRSEIHSVPEEVVRRARSAGRAVARTAATEADMIENQARAIATDVMRRGAAGARDVQHVISAHPWVAVGAAAAIGFLAAKVLRLRIL